LLRNMLYSSIPLGSALKPSPQQEHRSSWKMGMCQILVIIKGINIHNLPASSRTKSLVFFSSIA